jgi:hypothetical protein
MDEKIERVIRKFNSFEEADAADREYYASLTGNQRVEIVLELQRRYREAYFGYDHEAAERLERVIKVVPLKEG